MNQLQVFLRRIFFLALFCSASSANVLGEMQTFSPNTDGLDFITVHTARPLNQGYFAFSNYVNYAKDHLLVLRDINSNTNNQGVYDYHDQLVEYDFGVAYAVTSNLSVTFQAPVLLTYDSEIQDRMSITLYKGVHAYRPGFKYSFGDAKNPAWAILGSLDFPNVVDSPYTGVDPKQIYNIEGVYRWKNGTRAQAINVGYRQRSPTARPIPSFMFPLKSQLTASYGISDEFSKTARWVFETFVSTPVDKDPYKDTINASSIDLLLGMKHQWIRNLNFDWGATIEPAVESLSPDFRAFVGIVYYWKPKMASDPVEQASEPVTLATADVQTTVVEEETVKETVYALEINPSISRVYGGTEIEFSAVGGVKPYRFSVEGGDSEIDSSGLFSASFKTGTTNVVVTDKRGTKKRAQVQIISMPKADKTLNLKNLEFITAKAELTPASRKVIDGNIAQLKGINIERLVVEGHTDSVGKDLYNLKLSRSRSSYIKRYIINALGIEANRVSSIGYGETRPIATNATAAGRQNNRRVVLQLYYRK